MIYKRTVILLAIVILTGCKKPYNPSVINSPNNYLVVEGVINAAGITTIKLSRTVNLSGNSTVNPVTGAELNIEDNQNNSYPLSEVSPGSYSSDNLTLNNAFQYRLSIKTPGNQQYLSDLESVQLTPAIDSIGFIIQNNGVQIYSNAHDPTNKTQYYKWDYDETWQFHALYDSFYVSNGKTDVVVRTPAQMVYFCFANDTSSTVVIGSTARLTQSVIYQAPITQITSTSEKIELKYSINVRQYALSGDAFNFWTNLKKNTEQLGSIFDAQPSNLASNIHNVANASEPVIGYISVSTISSKRIFINNGQLPYAWAPTYPYNCGGNLDSAWYCHPITCNNDVLQFLVPSYTNEYPIYAFYNPYYKGGLSPAGYVATERECVDCTIRGTTKQPAFWK
jgi:hypothetical protein